MGPWGGNVSHDPASNKAVKVRLPPPALAAPHGALRLPHSARIVAFSGQLQCVTLCPKFFHRLSPWSSIDAGGRIRKIRLDASHYI